jgi:hypothetical protein
MKNPTSCRTTADRRWAFVAGRPDFDSIILAVTRGGCAAVQTMTNIIVGTPSWIDKSLIASGA